MNEPAKVSYSLGEMFSKLEHKIDSNYKEVTQKLDKQSEEIVSIKAILKAQQPLFRQYPI